MADGALESSSQGAVSVGAMAAQISTSLPSFAAEDPGDWSHLVDFARVADEAGFDRLVLSDHVVFGENLDAYSDPAIGGSRGGRQPTGPDGAWLEPLVTIAHLTAVTSRVRFGTNILIAALRRPVVLAKMAATIDVLSGGRLDLGVGVGWQREEYESAGLPFESRGRLLNQTIEVCLTLWSSKVSEFDSEGLAFSRIHQMPKPRQKDGVPIWVSGTVNRNAMDRLAKFGHGWIPWGDDSMDLEDGITRMRMAMDERGRDPQQIQVVGALRPVRGPDGHLDIEKTMTDVPRLRAAGVTDFRIPVAPRGEKVELEDRMRAIVSEFRALTS
jgi:probable F420-dependent oxidoreductase